MLLCLWQRKVSVVSPASSGIVRSVTCHKIGENLNSRIGVSTALDKILDGAVAILIDETSTLPPSYIQLFFQFIFSQMHDVKGMNTYLAQSRVSKYQWQDANAQWGLLDTTEKRWGSTVVEGKHERRKESNRQGFPRILSSWYEPGPTPPNPYRATTPN